METFHCYQTLCHQFGQSLYHSYKFDYSSASKYSSYQQANNQNKKKIVKRERKSLFIQIDADKDKSCYQLELFVWAVSSFKGLISKN